VARTIELAAEYSDNERKLADMGGDVVVALGRLSQVMAEDGGDELLSLVRGLIHSVTVHAPRGCDTLTIDFKGFLSQLLANPIMRDSGGIASSIPI
jgi:hypothetical protein